MTLTAGILYQRQYAAMLDQVKGYGGSLAKFMATQSAVPLLAEDYAAIDVFVQETLGRQDFPYLIVNDDEGVVRGSNDPKQVGQKYVPPPAAALVGSPDAEVTVRTHELDGGKVLDFDVPILFQKKPIGAVHLGIYEAPLARVANLVFVLLAILTLVTVAAVAAGTYLLARRIAAPIRVLKSSLDEIAHGRYDVRIGETRKDEFGEVYAAFDKTAAALEARHDPATATAAHAAAPETEPAPAVPG